ncbi:MAG: sulfatase-like hydrolase/transferase, partial [Kiritimatiellaeota bacterium]|nr:sulfatase-like hydrolase/transferase [Kiritimatiellota bacterium]
HVSGKLKQYTDIPQFDSYSEDELQHLSADKQKELIHGYYAATSCMDAQLQKVLNELDRLGLAENTIVVLWGDHGWQLGDHGLWHKHTNFEIATRVPLFFRVPGLKSAGQPCAVPVEFLDVYPTLADMCGLAIPAGLDGISLKPWLENPAAPAKKVAISQYPRGGAVTGNKQLMGYSIRDERWRMTAWRDRTDGSIDSTELYDEQNDPAESKNLAKDNPDVVKRLSAFLPPLIPYGGGKKAARAEPAKPKQDRGAMFDKRDKNHDGKLTREEFLANQPDPEEASKRFPKFDTNHDGFVDREEFIKGGKP